MVNYNSKNEIISIPYSKTRILHTQLFTLWTVEKTMLQKTGKFVKILVKKKFETQQAILATWYQMRHTRFY